jgi:hypothetical protein
MALSTYLIISFVAGIAGRSTFLAATQMHSFRPMCFWRGAPSLVWDSISLLTIPSQIFIIYLAHKSLGLTGLLVGFVVYMVGWGLGFQATRFGLVSPILNAGIIVFAFKVY